MHTTNTTHPIRLTSTLLGLGCAALLVCASGCDEPGEPDDIDESVQNDDDVDAPDDNGPSGPCGPGLDSPDEPSGPCLGAPEPESTPIKHAIQDPDGSLIIKGDDYRVRVHRSRRVAELIVGRELLSAWYARPFGRWATEATGRLYEVFADDFDFIVFVPATDEQHFALPDGDSVRVQNDIEGLGLPMFDNSSWYGSAGRLQHTVLLGAINHVAAGPSLRELGERWGNGVIPTAFADHFGFADVGGQLGGCSPGTIEPLGHDHWTCDFNGTTDWLPEGADENDRPYARLELYLMGFIGPAGVPQTEYVDDGVWVDEDAQVFSGKLHAADIDTIRAQYGKRSPSHLQSQREFRTLFVVLSADEEVDMPLFNHFDALVEEFAAPKPVVGWPGMLNFHEASSYQATLDAEQLDASLL